ncbi:MAG: site-2 protease family protein [Endomicrobium sp.]|jgi:regulator of sigma E protease|nr:site-2 protease family protein [Endomicrobium sp.]
MAVILQVVGVIVGLGFLVFIHELGHFFAAKMCKVRILTFAFGFGPDLIKYTYRGTKYCIKSIFFGGFISMAGESPAKTTGASGEYLSLKWYKKVWISLAGPLLNYILAVFIFAFVFNIWGTNQISDGFLIGSVTENYYMPYASLMLGDGDKVKSMEDGVKLSTWNNLSSNIKNKVYKQAVFAVKRGSFSFDLNMAIVKNPVMSIGTICVSPLILKMKPGFFKSIYFGVQTSITQTAMTVVYLVNKIISFEKPDISGPIGIMQVMANATKSGIYDYLRLLAIISIALGLFNLFPIPMVDGGMMVLFFIEGIIKRRISAKVVQVYNTIGLVFIFGIFLFATYSDLLRLGVSKLLKK